MALKIVQFVKKISNRATTRPLLFGLIKELISRKKKLKTCISNSAIPKPQHHLSLKQLKKANSNNSLY